jgi:hypothetical protein
MSKYGFNEIGVLYEAIDLTNNRYADNNYSPGSQDVWGPKNSYGTKGLIPTAVPGNVGTAYSMNQTTARFEEEDERIIPIGILKKKLNDLLQDAADRGMGFACEQLHELLQFIETSK